MNIAIATTDGLNVDEHFGRAKAFHIFAVKEDVFRLIKISELDEQYAPADKNHSFDKKRFQAITQKLTGCKKIFVTKIGDAPAKAFVDLGIEPVIYQGPISNIEI